MWVHLKSSLLIKRPVRYAQLRAHTPISPAQMQENNSTEEDSPEAVEHSVFTIELEQLSVGYLELDRTHNLNTQRIR